MALFWGKRKDWSSFPPRFVAKLKQTLGDAKFATLTTICQRHGVFSQKAFDDPTVFADETPFVPAIHGRTKGIYLLSCFLGSCGSALGKTQREEDTQDALDILEIAVCLMPENPIPRTTLATLCSCYSGLQEEAKNYARLAIACIENSPIRTPESIKPQMCEAMQVIIRGDYLG